MNTNNDFHFSEAGYRQGINETLVFKDIQTFIGSEMGDPTSKLAEKLPRTAKHVVTISWSWSPMHSRTSEYRIASDRHRAGWHLYEINPDFFSEKKLCMRVASGSPYKGMPADRAAYLLLKSVWKSEIDQWEFDPSDFGINEPGLLTHRDLLNIENELSWSTKVSWLREQSAKSLDVLRQQILEPIDNQSIEVFDEIETSASDLGLPKDFLALCKHYDLDRPSLLSLSCHIVRDATLIREQKSKKAVESVKKLKTAIDLLVSDLDDTPRRGGGMSLPSSRSITKSFLEKYVGEHDDLPKGKHETNSFLKSICNFDELRKKYAL